MICRYILLLAMLTVFNFGCDAGGDSSDTGGGDQLRSPLGKADTVGTCEGACDQKSLGNCWCDELCSYYGDCCSDYQSVCEAEDCEAQNTEKSCEVIVGCDWQTRTPTYTGPDVCVANVCEPQNNENDCIDTGECYWQTRTATYTGPDVCLPLPEPTTTVACGGYLGNTCAPQEFCSFAPEAICGWADANGTCAELPEVCPFLLDPSAAVCGCDGSNYQSECQANHAGASVSSQGVCPGTACDQRSPGNCINGDGLCTVEAQGCENPCTDIPGGGTVCNPCDPIPICVELVPCNQRMWSNCDSDGLCELSWQGCENPCETLSNGEVICNPCDPYPVCSDAP